MNAWFANLHDPTNHSDNDDKFIFYTGEGSQYFSDTVLSMKEFHTCILYLVESHPMCQDKDIKDNDFFTWIDIVGASLEYESLE